MELSESELEERSKRYGIERHFIAECPASDCLKPDAEFVYIGSVEDNSNVLSVAGYDLHLYNCGGKSGCGNTNVLQSIREYNQDSNIGSTPSSR